MMFARSEGSLRPRRASTSFLLPPQAAQTSVAKHQGVLLLAAARPPQTITAPKALSKSRAARGAHLVVLACSNNFREPQSVPAILRRHADSRPPPVHPSRQPVQRFSKWQFPVRDEARHGTFLEHQTHLIPKPKHPSPRWSCRFLSQHLIPILLHSVKSAGQLQNRQNSKLQVQRLGVSCRDSFLSRRPGTIFNSVGRFFRRAPLPSQGSLGFGKIPSLPKLALFLRAIARCSERRDRSTDSSSRTDRCCWCRRS